MEPLDAIEALARRARMETPPETNVPVGPVLRAYRAQQQMRLAPLAWSAAVSALAASVILVFALRQNISTGSDISTGSEQSQTTSVDSISPLFNAAQVQMP